MSDPKSDAAQRVQAADDAAYASQLAFALGPDKFLEHIEATYPPPNPEDPYQRLQDEYDKLMGTTVPRGQTPN